MTGRRDLQQRVRGRVGHDPAAVVGDDVIRIGIVGLLTGDGSQAPGRLRVGRRIGGQVHRGDSPARPDQEFPNRFPAGLDKALPPWLFTRRSCMTTAARPWLNATAAGPATSLLSASITEGRRTDFPSFGKHLVGPVII
jgi:hypothetical protein